VRLDKLIQLLHTVHGKQREFTAELVAILQREALLQHVNFSKSNSNLIEEKDKLEKKLKATDARLEISKVDSGKTEQLRKEYNLKVAALDKCELHIDKLQEELKEAKEQAEQLQSVADSNSQVDNLQQALKEEIERTTQLKTALDAKQQYIEKIEESSLEANNTLEEKIKESEKHILALKQDNHTHQNKNASLQKELDSAKQLNNQINATKEQIQNSYKQISLHSKVQATKIADLETIQGNIEQKVKTLNARIKDLEEREKVFKETEEFF
jgi:chromosome segregation ATPase